LSPQRPPPNICARYSQFDSKPSGPHPSPNAKKPPGNRVAFSLGRIVPTEARPSELSWRHSMGGLLGVSRPNHFRRKHKILRHLMEVYLRTLPRLAFAVLSPERNFSEINPCHLFVLLRQLHQPWFKQVAGECSYPATPVALPPHYRPLIAN